MLSKKEIERCQIHDGEWWESTELHFFAELKRGKPHTCIIIPKEVLEKLDISDDQFVHIEIRPA